MSVSQFQAWPQGRTGRRRCTEVDARVIVCRADCFLLVFFARFDGRRPRCRQCRGEGERFLETLDGPQRAEHSSSSTVPGSRRGPICQSRWCRATGCGSSELTQAATYRRPGRRCRRAEQGGFSEGHRHHECRRPNHQRRQQDALRHRKLLCRRVRQAVGDQAVDAAIRRSSPGHQRHDRRQGHHADADAHRHATRFVHQRRQDGAAPGTGERPGVQARQHARCRAEKASRARRQAPEPRARTRPGWQNE